MENEEILIPKKAVTPCGDFGCQSFPLIEGNVYHITEEELTKLGNHELKWSTEEYEVTEDLHDDEGEFTGQITVTKTRPILIENDPTEENALANKIKRIAELKKQLTDTDYEAIKYAEGEMSAEDYAPFKIKRASWRAEINLLEEDIAK